jgi:hypothetical protein
LKTNLDGTVAWLEFSVLDFYMLYISLAYMIFRREYQVAVDAFSSKADSVDPVHLSETISTAVSQRAWTRTLVWCVPMAFVGSPLALIYAALVFWKKI